MCDYWDSGNACTEMVDCAPELFDCPNDSYLWPRNWVHLLDETPFFGWRCPLHALPAIERDIEDACITGDAT
jgi:hypothetical protein